MLNYIWLAFLLIAVLVGGFTGKLPQMTEGAFKAAASAVMDIALPLIGVMAIWLGIMRLAERSGLVQVIARALQPLMRRLFPEVPPEHPAMGAMVMNMAANMLGLGNAATPLGLRAMTLLEKLNPHPGTATNAMCTFLAVNTASIQLIPTTAIGLLAVAGARNATAIVPAAFLATLVAACAGVLAAKVLERLPIFRVKTEPREITESSATAADIEEPLLEAAVLAPIGKWARLTIGVFFAAFVAMFVLLAFPQSLGRHAPLDLGTAKTLQDAVPAAVSLGTLLGPLSVPASAFTLSLPPEKGAVLRSLFAISVLAVPFLLSFFPLYAALRGVKVYEQFVDGAKEAFAVAQRIVPFLVAMLVAIRLLREAGVIALVTNALAPLLNAIRFPAELLPMVLMRPLSGSATQGLFVELINRPEVGADSLLARMAGTIYGSTETTFYVIAVYFGSVAVRQTRHAIAAGLFADAVAVIASITFCRLLFS